MIGRRKGYRVALVMPDNVTNERRQMAALYGAEVIDSPGALGQQRGDRAGQAPRQQGRAVRDAVPVRQPGEPAGPLRDDRPGDPGRLPGDRRLRRGPRHGRDADGRLALPARAQGRASGSSPPSRSPASWSRACARSTTGSSPRSSTRRMIDAKYLVSNRDAIAALRELVFREGIFAGPSCGAVMVAAARVASRWSPGRSSRCSPTAAGSTCRPARSRPTWTRWRRRSKAGSTGGDAEHDEGIDVADDPRADRRRRL